MYRPHRQSWSRTLPTSAKLRALWSVSRLSTAASSDIQLTTHAVRIMHVLTSVGIFEEVEVRQWRHNKFSSYFSHHDSPVGPAVFTLV